MEGTQRTEEKILEVTRLKTFVFPGFWLNQIFFSYLYSGQKIFFSFLLGWRTLLHLKACCIFIFVQHRGNYFLCSNNSSKFEGAYQWFTSELSLPPVHTVFATYSSWKLVKWMFLYHFPKSFEKLGLGNIIPEELLFI